MTAKFELGPDRRTAIDLLRELIGDDLKQQKALDMLLGILFKSEASLLNLTDGPDDYDDGKYLQSTADGLQWATPTASPERCRVTGTLTTASASTTDTAITFTTEVYDTDTMWAVGSPTIFTTTTAGVYLVTFNGEVKSSTATCEGSWLRLYDVTGSSVRGITTELGAGWSNPPCTNDYWWGVNFSYLGSFSAATNLRFDFGFYASGSPVAATMNDYTATFTRFA
jgi:hypothetical protein